MAKNAIGNFVASLMPGRHLMAVANLEVDLNQIPEGHSVTLEFRGKPLFVRHRTAEEIEQGLSKNNFWFRFFLLNSFLLVSFFSFFKRKFLLFLFSFFSAQSVSMKDLPDPQTDAERAKDPEYLIVLGVCTHLGCVPLGQKGDFNGWFCPCHGSHYDTSARIRAGPAPKNLEVPLYKYLPEREGKWVLVGEE